MKKTITYLLLLFAAITMNAQQWTQIGGEETFQPSASFSSIKTDPAGTPYVAYYSAASTGAKAHKYNGTNWEEVGGYFSDYPARDISLAFDAENTPYVAYTERNTNRSFVKRFDGNSWVIVGNPGLPNDAYDSLSLAISPSGEPYVSYLDYGNDQRASVLKFNGTSWELVGDPGISNSFVYATFIAIDASGTPYISFKAESNNSIVVKKFNGSSWENVGATGGIGESPILALDGNGTPYVAFKDFMMIGNMGYEFSVKKFNGTTWESLGSQGVGTGTYKSLTIDGNGTPYFAFSNVQNSYRAEVKKFNGTAWENVGEPGISQSYSDYISIAVSPSGVAFLAYKDAYSTAVEVMKFGEECNAPAPQFGAVQTCTEGTFADIKVFAPQLNFYASESADTVLGEDDAIVPGTYYVSQTFGCESPRSPVDIIAGDCHARTQLEAASCGVTLPQIDTKIYATAVPSADAYLFVVSDGTNTRNVFSQYRYFRLTELEGGYAYNTTYTIRVFTIVNGQPGFAGAACTVTTPAQSTTLTAASCNSTVTSFGSNIYANSRSFAEGYRFRITNGESVQTIDRPNTYFRLNQLATYGYGITYTVEVAVMINGEYGEYGPACTVTTPAAISKLKDSSCGITVPRFSTNLYANTLLLAEGYRFKVTNGANVQTIEGTASYFRLSQLASYQYNTAYTVHVAVKTNGAYGSYGDACTVTTPAPITQLRAQDCGTTVAAFGTNLYADSMLLATGYRFRVTNGATVNIVDRPNKNFRISMLPSYTYNTTYTVEVAVLVDGVWGDFGPACEVSTPPSGMRQNMANDEVAVRELTAFPNPFETSFTLALETESDEVVTIQAYDISGKMLDNRSIALEELSELKIGENYAAGIYSVIVTQGSFTKAIKMVKK